MASAQSNNKGAQMPSTGREGPSGIARLLPTLLPLGLLAMALILPGHMFESDQTASKIGLGPAAWPRAMLLAMALFSVLWIVRDIWVLRAAHRKPTLCIPVEDGHYHFGKAIAGLIMISVYGWLLPILGFSISTSVFIAVWCVFGGLRNPVVVIPVSVVGTIALLWLFMGLALMPLPRGAGFFDNFSIWLLRATGIY